MDEKDKLIICLPVCMLVLLILLFTSYNFMNNIIILVVIYGSMFIIGLTVFYIMNKINEIIIKE